MHVFNKPSAERIQNILRSCRDGAIGDITLHSYLESDLLLIKRYSYRENLLEYEKVTVQECWDWVCALRYKIVLDRMNKYANK